MSAGHVHVELFRGRAELARDLLQLHPAMADARLPAALRAEVVSGELTEVAPAQYRADSVVILRDETKRARFAIIVEVQGAVDRHKEMSWPYYLAAVRARYQCPTCLLVVALKPRVATWAKAPIALGHPGFWLRPLVISQADMPRMDLEKARLSPELAVMSALAHRTHESAEAALAGLAAISPEQAQLYLDAILSVLPADERQNLEKTMAINCPYRSDFARKYYFRGRKKGIKRGLVRGKQDAALVVARQKLGEVSSEEEGWIRSLRDDAQLDALISELSGTRSARRARAVLSQAKDLEPAAGSAA